MQYISNQNIYFFVNMKKNITLNKLTLFYVQEILVECSFWIKYSKATVESFNFASALACSYIEERIQEKKKTMKIEKERREEDCCFGCHFNAQVQKYVPTCECFYFYWFII